MSPLWGPVAWMTGVGAAAWACWSVLAPEPVNPEIGLGLLGPLVGADVSWVLMVRASAVGGEHLMKTMMRLLGAKVLLFGVYTVVMLRVMDVRPALFVVSFAGFFIALHVMEAVFLRRLLTQGARPPRG